MTRDVKSVCRIWAGGDDRRRVSGDKKTVRAGAADGFSSDIIPSRNYLAEIASTGQVLAQAPQSTHLSALISYLPLPSLIASTGQELTQAPQETHLSEIT